MNHIPVLLEPLVAAVVTNPKGLYLDGTFGAGGHARAVLDKLDPEGRIIAIDCDAEAIRANSNDDARLSLYHAHFANFPEILRKKNITSIDGAWFDLGVSSMQINQAARGFSFMQNAELDMRMNQTQGQSAKDWIATSSVDEMSCVFKKYGEERFAKRIATAIATTRARQPIHTTAALVNVIRQAQPRIDKHKHPATRVFQAIRIAINDELDQLTAMLQTIIDWLTPHSRLACISFHSLEDRIVKRFIRDEATPEFAHKNFAAGTLLRAARLKKISRITASQQEVDSNPRARSAVLRVAEKVQYAST